MPARTACDTCKRRKVKCDLVEPCANCRISRLTCEYTAIPRKRGRKSVRERASNEEGIDVENLHRATTADQRLGQATKRRRQRQGVENDEHTTDGADEEREIDVHGGLTQASATELVDHDFLLDQLDSQPQYLSVTPRSSPSGPDDHLTSNSTLSIAAQRSCEIALSPPSIFLSRISIGTGTSTDASPIELYAPVVARRIRENLASRVNVVLSSETIVDVIDKCVDLFIQYLFPNAPLVHEPTVRAEAALFQFGEQDCFYEHSEHASWRPRVNKLRSFVNVAALCASTLSVLPDSIIPVEYRNLTALFLDAARAMLGLYEEYDLEHPDSTSLTARIWLSTALQNTTGRTGLSWHYLWQASLLSQSLQLYDEEVVRQKPPIESHLLRMCFWQLYSADNAASAFGGRAFVLQKSLFHGDLTLLDHGEYDAPLLDASNPLYSLDFESRLLSGFSIKHRLWAAAGDFLFAVRAHSRWNRCEDTSDELEALALANLTRLYLAFVGLMDDIPTWLQYFDGADEMTGIDPEVPPYQKTCFYVQRVNLMSTFHCLHLVMLKRCIEHNLLACMGLENQPLPLAIKEVAMVNDLLKELHAVPFLCYKVQGEAAVERIRFVGASFLQLKQTTQIDLIKTRVSVLFRKLLDFLAKLDSRASDKLITEGG